MTLKTPIELTVLANPQAKTVTISLLDWQSSEGWSAGRIQVADSIACTLSGGILVGPRVVEASSAKPTRVYRW